MKSLKIPNQNPYIDGQKQHNGQKEKRPSTNTTQLMPPGKISRTCSTSGTRRVALVTNLAIGHE